MDNLTAGNPRAHRIRLYYAGTSTIYEGMPVCYEFDGTTNWFGGSVADTGEVTATTTTAEGSQNEGKYIRVGDVDADNEQAFAGVVTKGGWCGKTGPRALDVYVPNGAIVPVRTDQNCTVGTTVLCIHTAEQHLTGPYETAGRPVAIAAETEDASSAAAVVLATLDPNRFVYQVADAGKLHIDDQDTGNTLWLNKIKVDFTSATGNCCAFTSQATSSAGAATGTYYGLAMYCQADVSATPSGDLVASGHWLNLIGGTPTQPVTALMAGIYHSADCTVTSTTRVSVLTLVNQFAAGPAANTHQWIYLLQHGDYPPDFLFYAPATTSVALTSNTDTVDYGIPIRLGGATYYLAVTSATS